MPCQPREHDILQVVKQDCTQEYLQSSRALDDRTDMDYFKVSTVSKDSAVKALLASSINTPFKSP
jgi:hypothetical protein